MKIGVIGSGSMGSGIAQVAATYGHEVFMYDSNQSAVINARNNIMQGLSRLAEKGKLSEEEAKQIHHRIQGASQLSDLGSCGLVIEAIVENLEVKKHVFRELEMSVSKECILATNTSSLSVTAIAGACAHPERVIGIHFFNPATLMELVEIVPAIQTDPGVVNRSKSLIDSWKKRSVLAKDTPGFIVNRIARPFYGEAIRIYEEGIADIATIDWAMTQLGGFRMGPFALMDFIGNDVNYAVTESVFQSFYCDPRYKPSFTQRRLTEAGWLGRKTGRGHYNYAEGAEKSLPTEDPVLGKAIVDRIVAMLINEAVDALYLGIASREDIEVAMTKGTNYPKGLLQWGADWGYGAVVVQLDELYDIYHEDRYRCSVLMRKMV